MMAISLKELIKHVKLGRLLLLSLSFLIVLGFGSLSFSARNSEGWSEDVAMAMIGKAVACIRTPDEPLLKWGPRFRGWARSRQPKATGRPVEIGAIGTVGEVLEVSKGVYRIVVYWDPEGESDTYWTTVAGPEEYGTFIVDK